jgi:uncharacterized protein (UPF0332 family)
MNEIQPEDYIHYRLERADETLSEVNSHLINGFWNTAINRMYYACFYAVSALLVKNNVEVNSHTGVRQQFGQHYVKTGIIERDLGKHFTELFEKRNRGDYNDFVDYNENEARELMPKTIELVNQIKTLLNQ